MFARLFHRRLLNARDFAQYWIGARFLQRSGLENYMKRFYGVAPERIDVKFAEARMLWIQEHAKVRNLFRRLLRRAIGQELLNTQLVRPKKGFSYLYQGAVKRFEASGTTFWLGKRLLSLKKDDDVFVLHTEGGRFAADRVVSTIPLDRIQKLCGLSVEDRLMNVTFISLFFSFAGNRGFKQPVLYNFSHNGAWKRLTVYSDFYGKVDDREYFTAEVNADHVSGSVEQAERDFRRHITEHGLFAGDLRLEGHHVLSNAYPIYTDRADEFAAEVIAELRAIGIESIGRQGGFDYQPTARATTHKAEAALNGR